MTALLTLLFLGCLIGGLLAIAVAFLFPEQRVRALWLSTAMLLVASVLTILSIGIFLLVVPILTGLAAVSQRRRIDTTA